MNNEFDLFIIGGGINGAGIARDAAGRNLKVGLAEKGEIGGATSSWSTKLIHGGLRYLENYQFSLVRESLKEREVIYRIAPSITNPVPFIIPHTRKLRPAWLIKMGLMLYDNLGGKTRIPKSSTVKIQDQFPNILQPHYTKGFQYYDLQVDDQRLVKLNVSDAKKRGAEIFENTTVEKVIRNKDDWNVCLEGNKTVKSKILINATGPWVNEVLTNVIHVEPSKPMRLVKGSHIVTKKLYDAKVAFTLQNTDKRMIFVIPYKDDCTLIGTTEVEVQTPEMPKISDEEIKYLINCVNLYFTKQITPQNIVDTFSGVRPLVEDYNKNTSNIARDYILDLDANNHTAPLLNIYGGKLTTYRKLAERALFDLEKYLTENNNSWTDKQTMNLTN
jgi:glycerol-3-phosphate dehydrogenase